MKKNINQIDLISHTCKGPELSKLVIALSSGLLGFSIFSNTCYAATITVNTTSDNTQQLGEGDCSLREAIQSINLQGENGCEASGLPFGNNDTIDIDAAGTIVLENFGLTISQGVDITINGLDTVIDGSNNIENVLSVDSATLTMDEISISNADTGISASASNITLENCELTGNNDYGLIAFDSSNVSIDSCTVSGNGTLTAGFGVGVRDDSSLQVSNSFITQNLGMGASNGRNSNLVIETSTVSQNSRGGVGALDGGTSTTTINNSTISGNSGSLFGGIGTSDTVHILRLNNSQVTNNFSSTSGGGIISNSAYIENSIVSGNSVTDFGGGIVVNGVIGSLTIRNSEISDNYAGRRAAGIYVQSRPVNIENTTISGNVTPGIAGGSGAGGGLFFHGYVEGSFRHITVANNSAVNGAGIYAQSFVFGSNISPSLSFSNSIIGDSEVGFDCVRSDNSVSVNTDTVSIIELDNCSTNARNIDPKLLPLAINGSSTSTHGLLISSPAVNAAPASTCLQRDQRNVLRDIATDARCDIGAFESGFESNSNGDTLFYVIPLDDDKTVIIPL